MLNEKIAYKTTVSTDTNGIKVVMYYETPIVIFNDDAIILYTGDWWTRTTKQRMNLVSRHFNLGFSIEGKGKEWMIHFADAEHPFSSPKVRLDKKTKEVVPLIIDENLHLNQD